MAALPDLSVKFTADTAAFTAATQRMTREVESTRRSLETSFAAMRTSAMGFVRNFAGGLAGAFSLDAIVQFGRSAVDMAADLDEAAEQVGLTTRELQEYRFAANDAGATNEELSSSFAKLNQMIGEAASGNVEAVNAFARAGVAFRDIQGNARTAGPVFEDIVRQLSQIPSSAERAERGVALMGRGYQRLAPLINSGIDALQRLKSEAESMGAILPEDLTRRADALNRQWELMSTRLQVAIVPAFLRIGDYIRESVEEAERMINAIGRVAAALRNLVTGSTGPVGVPIPPRPPAVPPAAAAPRVIDQAGARGAAREAEQARREQERLIKNYDTLVSSLDRASGAQIQYRDTLREIAIAQQNNFGTEAERQQLMVRATEQYRDATLAAVDLTDAYANESASAEQLRDRIEALDQMLRVNTITAEQYATLMRRARAEASLGAEGWKDFTRATEGFASAVTGALEAAILRAESFRDVLKGLVQEIQKVLLQEMLLAPLRRAISGGLQSLGTFAFGSTTAAPAAGGTSLSGFGSAVPGAQAGAIVSAPTLMQVGEGAHTEAIVPMPNGRSIPVSLKGGTAANVSAAFHIDARNAEVGVERRIMAALRAYEPGLIARLMDQAKRGGAFAKAFGRA